MTPAQIKKLQPGDKIRLGPLLGFVADEIEFQCVALTGEFMMFDATYMGVHIGEAEFDGKKWKFSWQVEGA